MTTILDWATSEHTHEPDSRPLRQVFPVERGHRMKNCPGCGRLCAWSTFYGGYFCPNLTKGSGHPRDGSPVVYI